MIARQLVVLLVVAGIVLFVPIAGQLVAEPPSPAKPLNVLMVVGGGSHDYDALPRKLAANLGRDKDLAIRVTADLASLTEEEVARCDVLMFNNCQLPALAEPQQKVILAALRKNKGLVAMHCALSSFRDWPQWRKIIGGFVLTHDPYTAFDAVVVDRGHPITQGVPERFTLSDEPYLTVEFGDNNHVLIRTARPHGGRDKPEPMAWTTRYDGSRVFTVMFGHDAKSQEEPAFLKLLANGIRWAGGRLGPPTLLSEEERKEVFLPLFNGKTLENWRYDANCWKVKDGIIIGNSHPAGLKVNSFAITQQAFGDFILRFSVKFINGNTGVQFRSQELPNYEVAGYQADVVLPFGWGNLHEQNGRARLVDGWTGKADHAVSPGWNDMEVIAQGPRIILKTNGVTTVDWTEKDASRPKAGIIALQLHRGDPMEVQFTNLRIKPLLSRKDIPDSRDGGDGQGEGRGNNQ